jgi:hypothetical protein
MTERTQLIQAAIAEVQELRKVQFNGPDEQVQQLLDSYLPEDSLADLLWADAGAEASVQDIADLLSLWSWRTDDNGSGIMRTMERWIEEGTDSKKIAVALELDAYPFIDHRVRIAKLQCVAAKFPELAQRCQLVITKSKNLIERESYLGAST